MKKLFFILLIWIYPMLSFSAIDECKTDVYFANGILTDRETARGNAEDILKPAIIDKFGINYYNKHIGKVDYAYNRTISQGWDLFESVYQVVNLQELVDIGYDLISDTKATIHDIDLKAQVDKYKASITNGHRVLAVAHSQGNLYTQEAYEKLGKESKDGWMQKYFEAVSIASPDFVSVIKENTPEIGWDNDVVAWIGNGFSHSDLESCDVRRVEWEVKPHLIGDTPTPKLTDNYVNKSQVDTYQNGWWKAKEGWREKLDSNVHAFTFYMGEHIRDGKTGKVFKNPFDDQTLTDGSARTDIMTAIETQLDKLELKPSQWIPKNLGCLCKDKYAKITHEHDPDSMNKLLKGEKVKDFAEDEAGKIYQVEDKYVRAVCSGVKIEEIDEDEICYVLKDDASAKIGEIKGLKEHPKTKDGVVEIFLSWTKPELDYDLIVEWDAGEVDVKDTGCPMEHFHIKSEMNIYPGTYRVSIVPKDGSDEGWEDPDLYPFEIDLITRTPGASDKMHLCG